jgi:subtilase family serine protease
MNKKFIKHAVIRFLLIPSFLLVFLLFVFLPSAFSRSVFSADVFASVTVSRAITVDTFTARPPIHLFGAISDTPKGLSPDEIKKAYNLPSSGGKGVIAIIGVYESPSIENDLSVFDAEFSLPDCTVKNHCLTIHPLAKTSTKKTKKKSSGKGKRGGGGSGRGKGVKGNIVDPGWEMETALDVEWAHAIAPQAKILLVEAKSPTGTSLMQAVDYAKKQKGVTAVSMSWGGDEFPGEVKLNSHFKATKDISFFAASGDQGHGVSWPAVSSDVIAVGGSSLVTSGGKISGAVKEKAWSGSGGGISLYEKAPDYQAEYNIPKSNGKRSVPDVAYNADPHFGFSIYHVSDDGSASGDYGWYVVGGTSAGAPQWAAIKALGSGVSNINFYQDKAGDKNNSYFRDIPSGKNGNCGYYCKARKHYDFITGLGSPLTVDF